MSIISSISIFVPNIKQKAVPAVSNEPATSSKQKISKKDQKKFHMCPACNKLKW